jgi:hypothetical protein
MGTLPAFYKHLFLMNIPCENNKDIIKKMLYRFKSLKTNRVYLVEIECYRMNVYIIKFYPKNNSNSNNKFRILTGDYEVRRIVFTCFNILKEIYQQDERSSFGFIGENNEGESKKSTKRYRIYKRIVNSMFDQDTFSHIYHDEKSAYLLIRNTELEKNPTLIKEIEDNFMSIYNFESTYN